MPAPATNPHVEEANRQHRAYAAEHFWSANENSRANDPVAGEIRDARYGRAFSDYLRNGPADIAGDARTVLAAYNTERRDLSAGTASAGGYLVPPAFLPKLTVGLKRGSAMVRACNVVPTDSGASLSWPTVDDTGNIGAILAENTASAAQDVTFSSHSLGSFEYTSKIVRASLQLVTDSGFNLDTWLGLLLGRRIGRALNAHLTNGTGGGAQPTGLVPNTAVGVTGAVGSTTSLTYDNVVDLIGSVDAEYLEPIEGDTMPGFVGFMTSSAGLRMLRKVKDSQGEPIVTEGRPVTVLGYPVLINNDMPVPAANAKSTLFGAFGAGYVIRQARGRQVVLRLDERYGEALQVGYLAHGSYDGCPDDPAAVRAYQHAAT